MPISHSSTISMERMLLLYAILTKKFINVGKIILKEIYDCVKMKTRSAYFPSLVTSLCLWAHVKTQANLKGQYVQGCITSQDLKRLVEMVNELNQGEQEEPTEPETKESTDAMENEANLVSESEEESDIEPNSPQPVEGSTNPELRVELKEEPMLSLRHGRKFIEAKMELKKTKGMRQKNKKEDSCLFIYLFSVGILTSAMVLTKVGVHVSLLRSNLFSPILYLKSNALLLMP
ncbi:hypothetical protein J1N35_014408 [Gossypium stocksii]|uniref:Putative plant transposon protein domain-containing protein n=1 Tax=Gossypium stocksii TaxID=47602 RepID=A0A9D3VU83_9ROSI|nr:hypothetical protein J1N35_014408 [Gossypium stocksii]